jgi:MYXO-CTERM domain-containing protein
VGEVLLLRSYTRAEGLELRALYPGQTKLALMADLAPGEEGSMPSNLTPAAGKVFFTAYTSSVGAELYVLDVDSTPPVVTPVLSGTAGPGGAYASDVSVSFTVTDPESGVVSSAGCAPQVISADVAAQPVSCVAQSWGGTTTANLTVTRDTAAPQVSCPANMSVNVPAGSAVSFSPSATDGLDPAPAVVSDPASDSAFPMGTTTVTVTATDWAGNSASCQFDVTVKGATGCGCSSAAPGSSAVLGLFTLLLLARARRRARSLGAQ